MTQLELAISEIQKLPDAEQDQFLAWVLEELHSEERWQMLFKKSEDILTQMAAEALAEYDAGETEELNIETL